MAAQLENRDPKACIARGDALAAKRDFNGAVREYRQALALDPRSAAACRKLVEIYRDLRHPKPGVEVARRLVALEPESLFAATALADLLETLGQVDEAYAALAPRLRPGERDPYAATVFGRICGRLEPPRDEALAALGAVAADTALSPRERVRALWAMVHSLDALGRYDEAFARALELKALEARAGIARAPTGWDRIDAAIEAYTPERMARLPRATHGSQTPLFVLGMLRSGTTLVEQILAAHPEVHGAGELPDITQIAMRRLTAQAPYPACLDALDQRRVDELAAGYLEKLRAAAPGAARVVDKMPTNFEHLGLIELLAPQARVIHCVREPLDTCLSLYFLPDTSRTGSLEEVAIGYRRYQRIMRHWQSRLRLPMLTLRYEELVAEPERKVRELLEFCGLPWNDACLAFHASGRYSRNFSYHQVRQPLYARSVGRHRHYAKHLAPLKEALAAGHTPAAEHFVRARAAAGRGRQAEAVEAYRAAIAADPRLAPAHNNLGNLLTQMGRVDEALASLKRALEIDPGYARAHYNMGNALRRGARLPEAIAAFERAIELKPDYPEAINNLSNTLHDAERSAEAERLLRRALALRPDFAEAQHNLACLLRDVGRLDESLAAFRRTLEIAPDLKDAHFGIALLLLLRGEYLEGWHHYEWRWGWSEFPGRKEQLRGPMWRGERFEGKTLIMYFEQGLGDTLQFVRYLPMVAERGGRVQLEVQPSLLRLCAPLNRWATVIAGGERRQPYDLQIAMQSLPLIFGTTLQTIPAQVPYLHADAERARQWKSRIGEGPELKVGLVWAGNPLQKGEPKRGVGMEPCLPLFQLPGVRWFSLQVGARAADALLAPPGKLTDLSPHLTDFAETAAAVSNLDLVISSDTAPVHLAGALGARTWLMLRHQPDWRWHLERADCPWYPTMRLFRQPRPGDWPAVVAQVQAALAQLVQEKHAARRR